MKIGLFGYPGDPLCDAAESGLRALGHELIMQVASAWTEGSAYRDLGAVVVCGLRGPCGEASRFYRNLGTPVLLIDYPHLARGKGWWRISPPDLAYLPQFEGEAPRDRLDALGIQPQTRTRVKGQHVLVLGQRGGDPTHGMTRGEMQGWAESAVETLRSLTDSRIIWRPHPTEVYDIRGADGISDPRHESIAESFRGAWLVVTDSSTGGLEALIAGLPVIATGSPPYKDLTYDFSRFKHISPPDLDDLEELLARVAYTQWREDEIATGGPFAALLQDQGEVERSPDALSEIAALSEIPGIGEGAAERLHGAGITSQRVWSKTLGAEEVDALDLPEDEADALRAAAGIAPPDAELTKEQRAAEVDRIRQEIDGLGSKSAERILDAGYTLDTLADAPPGAIDDLGLAPAQAAALATYLKGD